MKPARPKALLFPLRSTFLRVLGVEAEAWAKRYGITPFTSPCSVCDRPCTTSVPFMVLGLRGLVAPTCECGSTSTPYAVVRDDGADILADNA